MVRPSAVFFSSRAAVMRPFVFADGTGAPRTEFKPVAELTDLACSVQSSSAHVRWLYGQRQIDMDHEVYFPEVIDLERGDRLDIVDGRKLILRGWSDEASQGRVFVVAASLLVK